MSSTRMFDPLGPNANPLGAAQERVGDDPPLDKEGPQHTVGDDARQIVTPAPPVLSKGPAVRSVPLHLR